MSAEEHATGADRSTGPRKVGTSNGMFERFLSRCAMSASNKDIPPDRAPGGLCSAVYYAGAGRIPSR
jgi:hypothetical protein